MIICTALPQTPQCMSSLLMQLIAASIPDSAFNHVKSGLSVKEVWKKLKQLYEGCTEMMMADLS
jgi:hypothetical protein